VYYVILISYKTHIILVVVGIDVIPVYLEK